MDRTPPQATGNVRILATRTYSSPRISRIRIRKSTKANLSLCGTMPILPSGSPLFIQPLPLSDPEVGVFSYWVWGNGIPVLNLFSRSREESTGCRRM